MPLLMLKTGILTLMLVCYHISTTPPVPSASTPERAKVKTSGTVGFVEAHMGTLTVLYKIIVTAALLIEIAGTFSASSSTPSVSPTPVVSSETAGVHISPLFCLGASLVVGAAWLRRACFRMMGSQFTFQMSIKEQHRLITNGPYAFVRHPSYTGLLLLTIGLTLCELSDGMWWTHAGIHQTAVGKALCLAWVWTVVHIGMVAARGWKEDALLRREFGSQWESYARNVRCLFFPGLI
ncbi:hypothetical protein PENSPDRAFT_104095 [Peniophora sp. CONT]|nr:hypothetical protein PENSPDRAFT_104095 [Peniophora sp. CONT]